MRRLPLFSFLAVLTLIAGCQTLGLDSPQSFNERMVFAAASTSAVYDSIAASTRAGSVTPDDAEDLIEIADRARDLLTSARRIHDAGQVDEASRQLALALAIVTELQQFTQRE